MNGLDIVLFNVISYLGGILSGILIHHKMTKSKNKGKNNEEKTVKEPVREKEIIDKHESPVLTATAIPTAPPPFNPGLSKRITITTE